jgi:hypothetical protein
MGETYPATDDAAYGGDEPYWAYYPVAKRDSGATALTADGFYYMLCPDGYDYGRDFIIVTYKLDKLSLTNDAKACKDDAFVYNSKAGYEVYITDYGTWFNY